MRRDEIVALSAGMALVLAGVYVAVSLATWDVSDPQLLRNYEAEPRIVRNSCGAGGALVSSFLYRAHGAAAFVVPLALAGLGALLVARRSTEGLLRRAGGAGVILLAFSLLAGSMRQGELGEFMATRSVEGPGGSFGAAPVATLSRFLGGAGTYLVIFFALATGMLLVSREVVEKALASLGRGALGAARSFGRLAARAPRALARRLRRRPVSGPVALAAATRLPTAGAPDRPAAGTRIPEKPASSRRTALKVVRPSVPVEVSRAAAAAGPTKGEPGPGRTDAKPAAGQAARGKETGDGYRLPPPEIFAAADAKSEVDPREIAKRGEQVVNTLAEFGIEARMVDCMRGPSVTMYELEIAPGIKVNTIVGLASNLAMAVMAPNVRVIAPIPGRSTVGIEVPNLRAEVVRLRPLLESDELADSDCAIPLLLGRDGEGRPLIADLAAMPHVLVAGTTGSGKSVCMHLMVNSILALRRPDEVRLLLMDPKMVELSRYRGIPHLVCPVVTEINRAARNLEWAVQEMEERYKALCNAGARDIASFNRLAPAERARRARKAGDGGQNRYATAMPYIVIMVDEFADLMMVASRQVEEAILRLAQKSRAVGIHVVLATQRPSVDVLTGLIRSNFPCRIAFQVATGLDSRIILDQNGAEKLLGQGDMLFLPPGSHVPVRAKGVYVSEDEITRILDHVRSQPIPAGRGVGSSVSSRRGCAPGEDLDGGDSADPMYDQAVAIILAAGRGSVSLLQRKLGVGYTRAGKLIDTMEANGLVGPVNGAKPRETLTTIEEWQGTRPRRSSRRKSA